MAADYEVEILSFLYCFLKYTEIPENSSLECYGILLNILKHYDDTITPATLLWILDTVDLVIKKIKFAHSINQKLKTDWYSFMKSVFFKIAGHLTN